MGQYYWTVLVASLTLVLVTARDDQAVMTWLIHQPPRWNHTFDLREYTLSSFTNCICGYDTKECELRKLANGSVASDVRAEGIHYPQKREDFTNIYSCSVGVTDAQCERLTTDGVQALTTCWTYEDNRHLCQLGKMKITWNPSQQFRLSYLNESAGIQFKKSPCTEKDKNDLSEYGYTIIDDEQVAYIVIGVNIGVLSLIVLVMAIVFIIWRKKRREESLDQSDYQ